MDVGKETKGKWRGMCDSEWEMCETGLKHHRFLLHVDFPHSHLITFFFWAKLLLDGNADQYQSYACML